MPLPQPIPGLVIHYSYLWHDEHRRGQEEGVKDRPCLIVSAILREHGEVTVTVAPLTHRPSLRQDDGVEIPLQTKHRLGLDEQRSWIVVTEVNRFQWPGPDLRQAPGKPTGVFVYGPVPPALLRQVGVAMQKKWNAGHMRLTAR